MQFRFEAGWRVSDADASSTLVEDLGPKRSRAVRDSGRLPHRRTFEEALVQWREAARKPLGDFTLVLQEIRARRSDIWDLKKPVLLLKFGTVGYEDDPAHFIANGRSPDVVTGAKLPRRLLAEGVTSLRLDIVQVWRPLCLSKLSSHFKGTQEAAKREANLIEEEARAHRAYKAAGVNVLLLSYADLLWHPEVALKRLHAFLPDGLLDGVNVEFTPKLGRDIFRGNQWKVQGSAAETLDGCLSTVRALSWTRRAR